MSGANPALGAAGTGRRPLGGGRGPGARAVLRRHPVKSMPGERIRAAEVTERGLAGDRRPALVDRETGKVAGAKNPRLWRPLLTCAARTDGSGVHRRGRSADRPARRQHPVER
ncbi:MOSC N-terminal beta barrel domain-containing protein [Streptomyces sp. NPDC058964]|uniref:MOSC N-terminal beta barrel domain-containing protein n=1 Tax=Streptomyces sp. NPDC058964 TaxID=3346681 RepID=UPI00369E0319